MKNILLFILSFIALPAWSQSVQYRPTAYTAPFVSTINSAAAAQTYLGIPSSTNNALLNGTNVFTGTNNFTGTVLITNAASTLAGNGASITNISPGNIVSNGTYLANGTLATNSGAISGGFLTETGTQRTYSLNAGSLTNIPAANLTGTAGTITAAGYTATQQTLAYSSGTNVTVDATKSIHFVTLTNTTYFPTPSGIAAGQSFTVILRQDATGGRAVTFQNTWNFPSGSIPTITTNASATDVLSCIVGPYGTNVLAVQNARFQ